jgi:hypothetical protein
VRPASTQHVCWMRPGCAGSDWPTGRTDEGVGTHDNTGDCEHPAIRLRQTRWDGFGWPGIKRIRSVSPLWSVSGGSIWERVRIFIGNLSKSGISNSGAQGVVSCDGSLYSWSAIRIKA